MCKASVAARLLLRPGIFLAVFALPAFRPLQGASCSPALHHAFSKLRVHQRVAPIIHGLRSESGGPRRPRCSRTSRSALSPSPSTYSLHVPGDSLGSLMNRGKTNRSCLCVALVARRGRWMDSVPDRVHVWGKPGVGIPWQGKVRPLSLSHRVCQSRIQSPCHQANAVAACAPLRSPCHSGPCCRLARPRSR